MLRCRRYIACPHGKVCIKRLSTTPVGNGHMYFRQGEGANIRKFLKITSTDERNLEETHW
jgi:hypothetical protein